MRRLLGRLITLSLFNRYLSPTPRSYSICERRVDGGSEAMFPKWKCGFLAFHLKLFKPLADLGE